ncbi:MAG: polyprenyl synthetase family protein [Chlorobi bacterium]|nr:polyprenyl synthetase family protein [Chlorobiota bacterium]
MSEINKIRAFIKPEMDKFNPFFKKAVKSNVPLLDIIMNYIIRRKGKQMRPMFVFLSAKLVGEVTESTYTAAALIELMHTATLIHDDVVDNSHKRRGFFSISALWRSKIAVLAGDFLLSKGLLLAVQKKEFELLEIVSEAVKEMAEGELLQMEKSRKLDISEETYFEIIYKKTATLIASCTAAGAASAGADEQTIKNLKQFGKNAGITFQIKDDLFDYQKTNLTGKPSGNDIQEKKMTLPLIYALKNANKSEKRHILKLVAKSSEKQSSVNEILNFVNDKNGLKYTEQILNEYKTKTLKNLDSLPNSLPKKYLSALVEYITVRKK